MNKLLEFKSQVLVDLFADKNSNLKERVLKFKTNYIKDESQKLFSDLRNEDIYGLTCIKNIPKYEIIKKVQNKMTLDEYINAWIHSVLLGLIDSYYPATNILYMIIKMKYGYNNSINILKSLWKERWIVGTEEAAFIWCQIFNEFCPITFEEEKEIKFKNLESCLLIAKETSATLDDWFEKLYQISPEITYLKFLYSEDESDTGKKRLRMIDEINADISEFLSVAASSLVNNREKLSDVYFKNLLDKDERSIKRALTYEYNGRVKYPLFWYEEVIHNINNVENINFYKLDNFNGVLLMGILLLFNPETFIISLGQGNGIETEDDYVESFNSAMVYAKKRVAKRNKFLKLHFGG